MRHFPAFGACALVCGLLVYGVVAGAQEAAPAQSTLRHFAVRLRPGPAWDKSKSTAEQMYFKEHSRNLNELRAAKQLVLGGRFADLGLLVIAAPDEATARQLITRDPSVANGVFEAQIDEWSTIFEGCAPTRAR